MTEEFQVGDVIKLRWWQPHWKHKVFGVAVKVDGSAILANWFSSSCSTGGHWVCGSDVIKLDGQELERAREVHSLWLIAH